MAILSGLLIGLVIQCLIGSLIGAIILRAACALFNKWFGKFTPATDQTEFQPIANPPVNRPDSQSPYAPPMAPLRQSNDGVYARGVVKPNFGKSFLICLVASIANIVLGFAVGLILGMVLQGEPHAAGIIIQFCVLVGGFVSMAAAIKFGLPTSFPRALSVAGLFLLIGLAVIIGIGLVVGMVMGLVSTFSP